MRRVLLILICAATVLVTAQPVQAKGCPDTVAISGERWNYQGTGVGCKFMKKWTRAYVRDDRKPKGYKCTKTEVNGTCRKGSKLFVFQVVQRAPKG